LPPPGPPIPPDVPNGEPVPALVRSSGADGLRHVHLAGHRHLFDAVHVVVELDGVIQADVGVGQVEFLGRVLDDRLLLDGRRGRGLGLVRQGQTQDPGNHHQDGDHGGVDDGAAEPDDQYLQQAGSVVVDHRRGDRPFRGGVIVVRHCTCFLGRTASTGCPQV